MLGEVGKGVREAPPPLQGGCAGVATTGPATPGSEGALQGWGVLPRVPPRPGVPELRGSL